MSILTDEVLWEAYLELGDTATIQNMTDRLYGLFAEGEITLDEIENAITTFADKNEVFIPDELEYATPRKKKATGHTPSSAEGAVGRSPTWKASVSTAERFKSPTGRSTYVPPIRLSFEDEPSSSKSKHRSRAASRSPLSSRARSRSLKGSRKSRNSSKQRDSKR